jgi:superfamily II DNA or RNA helicase
VSFKRSAASFKDNIVLRNEMQSAALEAMKEHYQIGGILNLGCGKGKSVLGLKLAAWLKVPTLIVVNTTALLEQWREEIMKHLGLVAEEIGIIQGDQCDWEGKSIAIAMIHTLSNKREQWPMEFREHWGLVVYDETHHLSAPHFVRSADLFYGWRIGLTATATRTDRLEAIYQYHIGRIFFTDLEQDLVPDTKFHVLDWDIPAKDSSKIRDKSGDVNLSKVRTYISNQKWRVALIVDKLIEDMEAGRTALVLSHSVPGVKALYEEYCRRVDDVHADEAGVIIGETEQEDRIPILRQRNPVFGTFQLAREGLDKPSLDTLYITTPFANSNDLQQAWGRIQRAFDGKLHPLIRVFEDTSVGVCTRSCQILRKFLRALKYPIDRIKERLDGRADEDGQEVARGHDGKPGKVRRALRGTERRAAERAAHQAGRRLGVHQSS